jgi:hypothetical protein
LKEKRKEKKRGKKGNGKEKWLQRRKNNVGVKPKL